MVPDQPRPSSSRPIASRAGSCPAVPATAHAWMSSAAPPRMTECLPYLSVSQPVTGANDMTPTIQQHVRPGLHGADSCFTDVEVLAHAAHCHGVGHDETSEAERLAEQAARHRARQRSRHGRVRFQGREGEVARHDALYAGCDRRPERHELERVQSASVDAQDWQAEVGIRVGIAVPREVFDRGDDPSRLRSPHESRHHPSDEIGAFAE